MLEPCEASTGGTAVRLGLSSVRGVGPELAAAIAEGAPYDSMEHLVRAMSQRRIAADGAGATGRPANGRRRTGRGRKRAGRLQPLSLPATLPSRDFR